MTYIITVLTEKTMQKVKLQHYVPRMYLKNFAFQRGKEYWTYCLDKYTLKQFPVNIKKIGCEKYFYEGKAEKQIIEKELSNLENDFSKVCEKLIESRSLLSLDWKEKEKIAHFVDVQDIRTREYRENIRSLGKGVKKWLGDKSLSKNLDEQLKTIDTKETTRSIHANLVTDTLSGKTGTTEMILNMKWILFENLTTIALWTSDQPTNRFNPIELNPFGNLGLKSQGIQIFFPLNPTLGILFCDPIEYFTSPNKVTCTKKHIIFNNTLQVRSSTRHIFSKSNDFYLAKKWLKENPDFINPKRKRIDVK